MSSSTTREVIIKRHSLHIMSTLLMKTSLKWQLFKLIFPNVIKRMYWTYTGPNLSTAIWIREELMGLYPSLFNYQVQMDSGGWQSHCFQMNTHWWAHHPPLDISVCNQGWSWVNSVCHKTRMHGCKKGTFRV